MTRVFTRNQLAKFKGQGGLPILVANDGKVYDVTSSYHWRWGKHHASHQAGQDLTEAMKLAPHGPDLLDRFPFSGILDG